MPMPGRSFSATTPYRYGFNGKENDRDISDGAQDYGMRISDVRLGRFLSTDPLGLEYPWYTPYQFAGNTPLQAIDIDGLEPWNVTFNGKTGSSVAVTTIYGPYKDATSAQNAVNRGWITNKQLQESYKQDVIRKYKNMGIAKIDKANAKMGEAFMKGVEKAMEVGQVAVQIYSIFLPAASTGSPLLKEGEVNAEKGIKDMQEIQAQADKSIEPLTKSGSYENHGGEFTDNNNRMLDQPYKGNAITRGSDRANQYSKDWQNASMKDAIEQFIPNANKTDIGGKTIYSSSQSNFQVVYDRGGNYFRIQRTDVQGKRSYTDLKGNIPTNKTVNGRTSGNSQAEYNSLTHFNDTGIKE